MTPTLAHIISYTLDERLGDHFYDYYIDLLILREIDIAEEAFELNKLDLDMRTWYNNMVDNCGLPRVYFGNAH